jgi:hypothetical protein
MIRSLIFFFAALAASACSVGSDDLVGDYVATYSYGEEQLHLDRDHTYSQRITLKADRSETTHAGKWGYDQTAPRLSLENALLLDDNFGKPNANFRKPSSGAWLLNVKTSWVA